MFQKLTHAGVADGTGCGWVQVFHLYRGSRRRYAGVGDFTKLSIRSMVSYPRPIRGRRYRPLRIGFVVRGFVCNVRAWVCFGDSARMRFLSNGVVLVRRRGMFRSKYVYSPLSRLVRRRQYGMLFAAVC